MENILKGLFGLSLFILIILVLWVLPVWLGTKWAKIKGVSKLWMLFGIHPLLGWIAFLVIRYGIDPRKQCHKCKESIKIDALICKYCGNEMSNQEVELALLDYEKRKK
jgi:hypothetical protein